MILSLPQKPSEAIASFQRLPLGGKEVVCPYYINTKRNKDLRAMVGKGTSEEIVVEARIWEKLKGADFENMTEAEIKQFLFDRGLGIDCSGFVVHVLNAWYESAYRAPIWRELRIPSKDLFSFLKYKLRPVEKLGAEILTNSENSYAININDVRPGDVIKSKWKKADTHHIQLISRVEFDEDVILIEYTHSTPYYGATNGVRTGQIKVIDAAKPLHEQEWLEVDEHGVNFSLEGFMVDPKENGLRRIKAMENLISTVTSSGPQA